MHPCVRLLVRAVRAVSQARGPSVPSREATRPLARPRLERLEERLSPSSLFPHNPSFPHNPG
jgi:hypothetical protein